MVNYNRLPRGLVGGMKRYLEDGIIPGSFLRAVLENNLSESFAQADLENRARMHDIVMFLYNDIPMDAWGSPEKVQKWAEERQNERST